MLNGVIFHTLKKHSYLFCSKVRESFIPKVTLSLHMLLCDESIPVQKRVIQATITIYRRTLAWLCKASTTTQEMEDAWKQLNAVKLEIANMIDR